MQNYDSSLRQLQANPLKVLAGARGGIKHDLATLSNHWTEMAPELLKMDVLSVFYGHLATSFIPTSVETSSISRGVSSTPAIDRAFLCLNALTKLGSYAHNPEYAIEAPTLDAWPAVYEWCSYLYTAGIVPTDKISPELRRSTMDLIGGVFYSLARFEAVRKTMIDTPGTVALATRIWIIEDDCPVPSGRAIPVNTAALDSLLKFPDWMPLLYEDRLTNDPSDPLAKAEENRLDAMADIREKVICARIDRVVSAAGGDPAFIVDLTFSRIRSATSTERLHEAGTAITLDLIGRLCGAATHPLRLRFLHEGMTRFVTKVAVTIVGMLDGAAYEAVTKTCSHGLERYQGLLDSLVSCLAFLYNTLESTDGFTWVAKSVGAGLLQAWTGAARHIDTRTFLDPGDSDLVFGIVDRIIPKYMVYKSVVNAVNGALKKLDDIKIDQWINPKGKEVWTKFQTLARQRYETGQQMKTQKSAACDNYANCHNIDLKNNFMKCSGCSITLYCSRECQKVAWKEGGHKLVCKLKQQEMLEGKSQSISKSDIAFFHHLAATDARRNLRYLRSLAELTYPSLAKLPTSLVISIDYMVYPPRLSLHPLADHEKYSPRRADNVSPNAELRNNELVQRARDHPGQYGIVQSKLAYGQGVQSVLSIIPGKLLQEQGWGR